MGRPRWLVARLPLPRGNTVGRAGRSDGPYAFTVPTVKTVCTQTPGRVTNQADTMPRTCSVATHIGTEHQTAALPCDLWWVRGQP